jgi:hypothetical protein
MGLENAKQRLFLVFTIQNVKQKAKIAETARKYNFI